jgi:hypothetical protein
LRPERLSAKRSRAAKPLGRSPDLENQFITARWRSNYKSHHSGATARDFNPLPYSPRLLGHPDAFKYKEQFLTAIVIRADTITRFRALSNSAPNHKKGVPEVHLAIASAMGVQ